MTMPGKSCGLPSTEGAVAAWLRCAVLPTDLRDEAARELYYLVDVGMPAPSH